MEETAKHSTENMWFWPSCFLIPFPLAPGFTYLRLFVWKLLMLVSDSSLSYISFLLLPFILFHLCLTSLTNCSPFFFHSTVSPAFSLSLSLPLFLSSALFAEPAWRAHRYRRHHHKGRRERRKHKRHGHREGGRHGGFGGQGHNHAHFWTKMKNIPFLFSPVLPTAVFLFPCRPVLPLSPNTTSHFTVKNCPSPPPCTTQPNP